MKPDEQDLHSLDSHFRFGENWSEFEKKVGEERIAFAIESLDRLIEKTSLSGSKVIDIGCGSGVLGSFLKKKYGCNVTGIEVLKEYSNIAKKKLDKVIVGNFETMDLKDHKSKFNYVIFSDSLGTDIDASADNSDKMVRSRLSTFAS